MVGGRTSYETSLEVELRFKFLGEAPRASGEVAMRGREDGTVPLLCCVGVFHSHMSRMALGTAILVFRA